MSTTWRKLAKDKRYREEFASAMLKRMVPYQARAIRKGRGLSQAALAELAGVTQGVISRAEDPGYGNLTLTTIGRIAAGYDLAAIVRFVPFSELVRYSETSTENEFAGLPTFERENAIALTEGTSAVLGTPKAPSLEEFAKGTNGNATLHLIPEKRIPSSENTFYIGGYDAALRGHAGASVGVH